MPERRQGSNMSECKCNQCGIIIQRNKGEIDKSKRKGYVNYFCSNKCHGIFRNKKETCICKFCKKEFLKSQAFIRGGRGIFCSKYCQAEFQKILKGTYSSNFIHGLTGTKEYWKIKSHERRVRKVNNGGTYTIAEWEQLKNKFKYTCPFCFRKEPEIKLTVDHILPVSLGGSNDITNIQPLCGSCNSRKRTKEIRFYPIEQLGLVI